MQLVHNFVSHLECSLTGERHPANELIGLSRAGKPLLVRYDMPRVKRAMTKEKLKSRPPEMWRYKELLPSPPDGAFVSLGEVITPLIPAQRVGQRLGARPVQIKDEGRLPTGSFKSRGIAVAVTKAREFGVKKMAMPTAGNAGAALAAYCTRAGIESFIFCPDDAPEITISEIAFHGGRVWRVNGIITELGRIVESGSARMGWFNVSTLKEPYRLEGKKTMGFELAEQFDWELPDAIFYPTGGGTGLIGMWKAFEELENLGWIGPSRPMMIAVQSSTCAPIVKAFDAGKEFADPWLGGHTSVPGLRVPSTIGDFLILRVLRESGGFAVAIEDEEIELARTEMAETDGIHLCPEGAATFAAYKICLMDRRVDPSARVVLFNCATGLKYPMPGVRSKFDLNTPIERLGL